MLACARFSAPMRYSPPFVPGRLFEILTWVLIALAVVLVMAIRQKGQKLDRRRKILAVVGGGAWFFLYALSCPYCSNRLIYRMETRATDYGQALATVDLNKTAIVVLSGSTRSDDPDIEPAELLDSASSARVLAAARVYHEHPTALVIPTGAPPAMGRAMTDLLTRLGVPRERIVAEIEAQNTDQNAQNSVAILRARGMETAIVVTSALHLRRAVHAFERTGIRTLAAPGDILGYTPGRAFPLTDLLPSAEALSESQVALHEVIGALRERLR